MHKNHTKNIFLRIDVIRSQTLLLIQKNLLQEIGSSKWIFLAGMKRAKKIGPETRIWSEKIDSSQPYHTNPRKNQVCCSNAMLTTNYRESGLSWIL